MKDQNEITVIKSIIYWKIKKAKVEEMILERGLMMTVHDESKMKKKIKWG